MDLCNEKHSELDLGEKGYKGRVVFRGDIVNDETINYMAPMAQGLLGLSAGDVGKMPSPTGPIKVKIDSVDRIDLQ